MLNRQQLFGKKSESIAVKFLKKQGYKIIEQNFRTKLGEIDIIAKEKGTIAWRIKFRNGKKDFDLLAPITTVPWGTGFPNLSEAAAPSSDMVNSELLYNEPKYVAMNDNALMTLESNGLEIKEGVYY